jgi:hypothetical protein
MLANLPPQNASNPLFFFSNCCLSLTVVQWDDARTECGPKWLKSPIIYVTSALLELDPPSEHGPTQNMRFIVVRCMLSNDKKYTTIV